MSGILSDYYKFLVVKFSIYLNKRVFVFSLCTACRSLFTLSLGVAVRLCCGYFSLRKHAYSNI